MSEDVFTFDRLPMARRDRITAEEREMIDTAIAEGRVTVVPMGADSGLPTLFNHRAAASRKRAVVRGVLSAASAYVRRRQDA